MWTTEYSPETKPPRMLLILFLVRHRRSGVQHRHKKIFKSFYQEIVLNSISLGQKQSNFVKAKGMCNLSYLYKALTDTCFSLKVWTAQFISIFALIYMNFCCNIFYRCLCGINKHRFRKAFAYDLRIFLLNLFKNRP